MRIGFSHIAGSNANRLGETSRAIARALNRLSTGSRLQNPASDIASYSTSVRLSAQSNALAQMIKNSNLNYSMLAVSDQAIASQLDIVQKMRELAVQGANGTLNASDRVKLNNEMRSLLEEFNRVADSTEFNGRDLLTEGISEFDISRSVATNTFTHLAGQGTFNLTNTSIANSPSYLSDLDGDGDEDLISGTGTARVYLNNGSGVFALKSTFVSSDDTQDGKLADLNGDGLDDFVYSSGTDYIYIHYNQGDGRFGAVQTIDTGEINAETQTGDVDNDGDEDLVVGGAHSTISQVWLNNGLGTFTLKQTFSPNGDFNDYLTYLAASAGGNSHNTTNLVDLNADGNLDLVTATESYGAFVHYGDGTGVFGSAVTISLNTGVEVTTGDFNGDGLIDVAAINAFGDENLLIYLQQSSGAFVDTTGTSFGMGIYSLKSGDFDGDGVDDIAASSDSYTHLVLSKKTDITLAGGYSDIGDINGDGVLDLMSDAGAFIQNVAQQLALSQLDLSSTEGSQISIGILDSAIQHLIDRRSKIAVAQSGLEFSRSYSENMKSALDEARSSITDADLAAETTELTRLQIQQQAQIAVAMQANLQMRSVLELLRF